MTEITKTLSTYVANLRYDDMPAEVPERAKHLMIDLVGSIVRAGRESDSTPSIMRMIERLGLGAPGEARVFGQDRRYSPATAALLNGVLGHSLDFDDTHADSSLHPSAPVVPAALAAAEMAGASGRDLLVAIVAGFEVCCRLGNALDPTSHYARGFHPTATAGTFGAAAAAGKLLGLDAAGIASAFGVAASQAAGSLQFLVNGGWNKRYQVGAAAMNGLIAATLASEGFIGAAEAIEGKHGFLHGHTDNARPDMAVAGLGSIFETRKIGMKPYPSCRYTHAAIDGLIALRKEHGWSADDIIAVTIGLHRNGIVLTGAPLAEKQRPRSVVDGQFSMPFTAAVALHQGHFGWDDYALIGDAGIEAITARIDVRQDERLEGLRHPFGAHIAVRAVDGTYSLMIPDPSGEPDSFPPLDRVEEKFMTLARPVLGNEASALYARLAAVEGIQDMRGLLDQ
ncbi:MmgE/PrpD family protein [Hoeflea alexandrii]|uniref:MmgE/PrpD family protein n=1 Tax=Hoeflea alexandrii TaxID=288436 RepID=UPI0022AF53B2|nr:MmgE/PrpD family protein [Hoeflea alexandrii]MCZ4291736.1 MmgE/PrpD family protein [Hoeflea alexandrii]